MRVPAAPLARFGLPAGGGWSYEVRWDGFRCPVDTHSHCALLSARSAHALPLELVAAADALERRRTANQAAG